MARFTVGRMNAFGGAGAAAAPLNGHRSARFSARSLAFLPLRRAVMEEDYAKKLNKLSRHGFGAGETGYAFSLTLLLGES